MKAARRSHGANELALAIRSIGHLENRGRHHPRFAGLPALVLLILALVVLPGPTLAKKPSKTYPEQGKVTATSVNQVPYHQTVGGANGTTISVHRIRITRTYEVVTDNRIYQLDCGKTPPIFSSTPEECGGDKKIQIGDLIRFRLEKGWAYIPAVETVTDSSTYVKQSVCTEERLRVLSEELKPDAKPADQSPTPAQGDAKPQGSHQIGP
jgi:hypothetical protein